MLFLPFYFAFTLMQAGAADRAIRDIVSHDSRVIEVYYVIKCKFAERNAVKMWQLLLSDNLYPMSNFSDNRSTT